MKEVHVQHACKVMLCVFSLSGALDSSGRHQSGISHEFFLMFSAVDENRSWYLEENIKKFCPGHDVFKLKNDVKLQNSRRLHCKLFLFQTSKAPFFFNIVLS